MVNLLSSSAQRSIEVIELDVPTNLTIIAPDSVTQGENFNIVGLLLRADPSAPIPGAMIRISYNGVTLGNVFADDLGRYLLATSIDTLGTFVLTASYAGGSGYTASEARTGLSVGAPTPLTVIISIVLPIVTGLGIVALSGRR